MIKEAMEKVPNGKLLRIKLDLSSKINKVQVLGDFFVHPEESIIDIESILSKLDINYDEKREIQNLKDYVEKNKIQLIGLDEEAIFRVLKKAIEK